MSGRSGKLLAVGMLCLGLAAALLSTAYRRAQTEQALAFWGAEQAATIATAPEVTALGFDPPLDENAAKMADEIANRPGDRRARIERAEGFATVRTLLIEDGSFDWQTRFDQGPTEWPWGIAFAGGRGPTVVVLFDPVNRCVTKPHGRRWARLTASAATQLKAFLEAQFPAADGARQAEKAPAE